MSARTILAPWVEFKYVKYSVFTKYLACYIPEMIQKGVGSSRLTNRFLDLQNSASRSMKLITKNRSIFTGRNRDGVIKIKAAGNRIEKEVSIERRQATLNVLTLSLT